MLKLRRVSEHVIKPIKTSCLSKGDIQGSDVFDLPFGNIYLCASTASGKTNAIFEIIKTVCNKKTNVLVFCSTIYNDPNWDHIQKYLEDRNMIHNFEDSIFDPETKENRLKSLLGELKEKAEKRLIKKNNDNTDDTPIINPIILCDNNDDDNKEKHDEDIFNDDLDINMMSKHKKRKNKFAQKYLIILDDLSDELRKDKSLEILCKKSRHFNIRVILSSQYLNDISPGTMRQMYYGCLWGGHGTDKLKLIHKNMDLSFIKFDLFERIYLAITSKPYQFLFVDRKNKQLRKNFNLLIELDN